jgi:nudix-type nucleoside diphosphatase (YffH/AdpP family)
MAEKDESPIRNLTETVLSDEHFLLRRMEFEQRRRDGTWQSLSRELYDHGDAVALLPYDTARGIVLLVRQVRFVTYLYGHPHPIIEVCAGMLNSREDPETAILREAEEEIGIRISNLRRVFDAFMSPGGFTEKLYFFVGTYDQADRVGRGGGLAEEGEDIAVLEMPLDEAVAMISDGRIVDAKTIMLLQWAKLNPIESTQPPVASPQPG